MSRNKKRKKSFLYSNIGSLLLYGILRIYSSTFRITVSNESDWVQYLDGGGRVLLLSWHQQFLPFSIFFRRYSKYHPSLMISQSKDGELIARIANRIGWQTARGSSSKDGLKALDDMKEKLKKNRLAGHIADGPRGPIGVVKKGAIHLAHDCNAKIVPVYAFAESAWICSSWDRFMVPKPFSKILISFDRSIELSENMTANELDEKRTEVQNIMLPHLL